MYDIIIVGGGVIGTSTAYELAKYDLKIALVEKNSDLCLEQYTPCFWPFILYIACFLQSS